MPYQGHLWFSHQQKRCHITFLLWGSEYIYICIIHSQNAICIIFANIGLYYSIPQINEPECSELLIDSEATCSKNGSGCQVDVSPVAKKKYECSIRTAGKSCPTEFGHCMGQFYYERLVGYCNQHPHRGNHIIVSTEIFLTILPSVLDMMEATLCIQDMCVHGRFEPCKSHTTFCRMALNVYMLQYEN